MKNKLLEMFRIPGSCNRVGQVPYIIAEAGVNHEGDISLAKRLVREASVAGADAIKFQSYKAASLASIHSPAYWDRTKEPTSSQYNLFKKYDNFGKVEFEEIKRCCDDHNIEFMSTPFDIESAKYLSELVNVFKISSSDITNKPFIEIVCGYGKPIILSTGASDTAEIEDAVRWIDASRVPVALMHCVLNYPTENKNAHLGMIVDLSHAGKQTCLDAIHHSSKPIAISHANPSFFHKALRNIDNDVLIELAKKNGFIGLSLYPYHLKNLGKCTIEDYCSMVKQLINLIGIEHIGIGSDLCKNWPDEVVMWMRNGKWTKKIDYGESTSKSTAWPEQPSWFTKASDLKNIFESLVINGLTDDQAFKIIGTNWFEFMKNHF